MADTAQDRRNVSQWVAIIAMVIMASGSLAVNFSQAAKLRGFETLNTNVQTHSARIAANSRLIYGLDKDVAYIRTRVDEIMVELKDLKK